jgi:hypothetical protein
MENIPPRNRICWKMGALELEIIFGLAVILFILFIVNSFLSIAKELKELNSKNKRMVEILEEIKKRPLN